LAKFRKKKSWLFPVTTKTGGTSRNGKAGIGGSGVKKVGTKTFKRTSWHQRKVPIANPKSKTRYVRAKPNYDAKTKKFTGLTASEMAATRKGKTKIVKEKSWYYWPKTYNEESRVWYWFSNPVWSVYEESEK
jgi:hypothetical protein